MLLAGPTPTWIAPLATGHPLGLPGAQKQTPPQQRVQPPAQPRDASSTLTRDAPLPQQWRDHATVDPDPTTHVAPPSIMQIKISQMLVEQARRKEPSDETDPEPANVDTPPEEADRPMTMVRGTKDFEGMETARQMAAAPEETDDGETSPPERETDEAAKAVQENARSGYEAASNLSRAVL
ncbi:hypothetical protein [Tropicibacter sp. S64]|uniref:hypothetical protein n=1 Tax=Tropicibacter sp. S64 TaxID=3415122 RepID=UPI003C7D4260